VPNLLAVLGIAFVVAAGIGVERTGAGRPSQASPPRDDELAESEISPR
jgi:hypothetical protein